MRILVTGTSGFIGSYLTDKLVERGEDVYSIERYVTGRYYQIRRNLVRTLYADLTDYSAVRRILREVQPEYVVHVAAISPVAYSYEHPLEVLNTNFNATINLAEACRTEVYHFKQFLFASTSETYGNGPDPKTESTPRNPNTPYAVSKAACEDYLRYMWEVYRFPVTILRPFNTYGRHENTHFVVERAISQMLTQREVMLGDPKPTRDLLYVHDHVNAYLTCLDNSKAIGETFNFCTGRAITIGELVKMLAKMVGFKGQILWNQIPTRPLDIVHLTGSYAKAKRVLGWQPKYELEGGIPLVIDYWRRKLKLRR